MAVRTVLFEVLRHGPPGNQLLSTLTPYLVLSNRHEAVTVNLPWNHARFERELKNLRYGAGHGEAPEMGKVNQADLKEIGKHVGEVFQAVPGFWDDLAQAGTDLVHLRLICNAAELALVPFEMVIAPQGFRGAGTHLSLHRDPPLVITREVRGVTSHAVRWPTTPRVLFAYAAPRDLPPIPNGVIDAHLQALVEALAPWTGIGIDADDKEVSTRLKSMLTILPDVTLDDLRAAIRKGDPYTHVHILAHGIQYEEDDYDHHGVALFESGTRRSEAIGASKLKDALTRPVDYRASDRGSPIPAVVSLAACNTAASGQVIFPVNLAHELHAAGIPLVVASLYPLWPAGSITLTQALYTGLLRGDDPREVLHRTRYELSGQAKSAHDWASMVAYAAFPEDLATRATQIRYEASRSAILKLNKQIEVLVERGPGSEAQLLDRIAKLDEAASAMPVDAGYEIEGRGMLGSKDKRKAQALFLMAKNPAASEDKKKYLSDSFDALRAARDNYKRASRSRTVNLHEQWKTAAPHWVMTQWLGLDAALGKTIDPSAWRQARAAAEVDLGSSESDDVVWTHGSLIELYLLCSLTKGDNTSHLPAPELCWKEASQSATLLAEAGGQKPYFVTSTISQLKRYGEWWSDPVWVDHLKEKGTRRDEAAWKKLCEEIARINEILRAAL